MSNDESLVRLQIHQFPLTPCVMEALNLRHAYNLGNSATGLGILFTGAWIASGEIELRDVAVLAHYGAMDKREIRPIELRRVKCSDGSEGLYWEDPEFVIPKVMNPKLSKIKQSQRIFEELFGVQFVPCGNARKVLDIAVTFIPLENKEGRASWYVYRGHKTKLDYITAHNRDWKEAAGEMGQNAGLLNPEDYDL